MIKKFTLLFIMIMGCTYGILNAQGRKDKINNTSLLVTVSVDFDCNQQITKAESRILFFTATIQKGAIRKTLVADKTSSVTFAELEEGTYDLEVSLTANQKFYKQNYSVVVKKDETVAYNAIVNSHCIAEKPKDTTEIVVKPKCGDWINSEIEVNNLQLTKGDRNILNREIITARLKATFNFDLNYSIRYMQNKKEVKEKCVINYKVRYPNGSVSNFKNSFSLNIKEPGSYSIEYSVNCNGNICVSGVKFIRCDEQIICNCGTPNEELQITVREKKSITYTKTTRDSIIFNKARKTWINHVVNCEGNICDGTSSYAIKDASGRIVQSGSFYGRFTPNLPVGNQYQLLVTDFCGGKNCATHTYNFAVIDTGSVTHRAKVRVGIHGDVHLNIPKYTNLNKNRATVNGMIGLIADFGLGNKQQFHLWPSLNLVWYRYSGENVNTSSSNDFKAIYKSRALELGLDASFELIRKNESALHIYLGGGLDFEKTRKEKFTGSATGINTWKTANTGTDSSSTNLKASIGLLYEINYKWMLGLNYYTYDMVRRKDMLINGKNNGVALRLAYFFNRRK